MPVQRLPTPIHTLTNALNGGWDAGEFVVISSQIREIRTAFLSQITLTALRNDRPLLYVTNGRDDTNIVKELVAYAQHSGMTQPQFASIFPQLRIQGSAPEKKLSTIATTIKQLVHQQECSAVVIEDINMIIPDIEHRQPVKPEWEDFWDQDDGHLSLSSNYDTTLLSRELKTMALERHIPIIVSQSLVGSRDDPHFARRQPTLADLGNFPFEGDADEVIFLYPDAASREHYHLHVIKYRHGPAVHLMVRYQHGYFIAT